MIYDKIIDVKKRECKITHFFGRKEQYDIFHHKKRETSISLFTFI